MKRIVLLAALQAAVLLGWAAQQEIVRAQAPTFRIPLAPVDPFDVLRGRYFILNPRDGSAFTAVEPASPLTAAEADRFAGGAPNRAFDGPAQVGFCPDGELWRICALRALGETPPAGAASFWSRAEVSLTHHDSAWWQGEEVRTPGWIVHVDLGLDKFFLPNRLQLPAAEAAEGWELEVAHRPGQTPLPLRLWFRGQPVWPALPAVP